MNNKSTTPLPEIHPLVLELMPHASRERQVEATTNLRAYIAIVHRIFLRLEAEGKLDTIYDRRHGQDFSNSGQKGDCME